MDRSGHILCYRYIKVPVYSDRPFIFLYTCSTGRIINFSARAFIRLVRLVMAGVNDRVIAALVVADNRGLTLTLTVTDGLLHINRLQILHVTRVTG